LKQFNKILIVLITLGAISACTVKKSRSDISKLGELYHNTTAHYNGYFNANELLEASLLRLEEQYEENYTKLLPMYTYLEAENPQAVAQDLDLAIEKVSVVVNLHRYSKWTDDCYLLFGKAKFLKQDYESAEEAFRFFASEFNPEKMNEDKKKSREDRKADRKKSSKQRKKEIKQRRKDRKKERKQKERAREKYNKAVRKARKKGKKAPEKPDILKRDDEKEEVTEEEKEESEEDKKDDKGDDSGFLKHEPAYQEGMVWYAKTLIERDKYDAAERVMDELENDHKTYEHIRTKLAAVRAYSYIAQEQYGLAIPAIRQAIKREKDKALKSRYAYIMAQLFELENNYKGAYNGYQEALKYRPGYTMAFNCRLNIAQNAYSSGQGSAEAARKNLEKLLKDPKNINYKDQIYFAMAEIDMEAGDLASAITNYQLSLKNSVQNRAQKAESYLALAEIYYDRENYVPAKNYFDSTLQVMAASDDRYKEVEAFANNLKEIA